MIPFTAPIDDILFTLDKVAHADRIPGWDRETAEGIVGHFASFAEGVIAPLNTIGDTQGCRLENGRVRMPDGFTDAYAQLRDGGWQGLTAPEAHGGMALDPVLAAAVSEVFSGANHAFQMLCNLVPGAISTLLAHGSASQQARWIPELASGEALATMCLTEAGAGSDLSRIRTKARKAGERWLIEGEKIFISGGDQDMSGNILHLVLCRTGAVEDGVKGLSLFMTDRAGAGDRIRVTRIEEKIGLHASPTCQVAFSDAPAELLGTEGGGLSAMFTMMNHARLDVSLQGVAHAARAHAIARHYADERRQGRRPDGTDAVLSDHADVRRMLDQQQSLALGARAMALLTAVELELGARPELVDFLTPICKVFCSEAGIRAADIGIQILGGYGYVEEYMISQTWRDARICAIYEGANGIHALTTARRGLRAAGGAGAKAFADLVGELAPGDASVSGLLTLWLRERDRVLAAADPAPLAHDFTQLTAELFFRATWVKLLSASTGTPRGPEFERLAAVVARRPSPMPFGAAEPVA